MSKAALVPKARGSDFLGRFREILQDPLNLLINRVPLAGVVDAAGMVTLHNGLCVPLTGPDAYYGDFSRILVANRGVHEPLEELLFQEALRRTPGTGVMLELGAYWGHYAMWAQLHHPELHCILVEPDAARLEVGRRNFARNQRRGTFMPGRVGAGELDLDSICDIQGISHVEILHVDIQGAEAHLLANGIGRLRRHAVDLVFLSTHEQSLHTEAVARLTALGYSIKAAADFATDTSSYDGFILAVAPAMAGQWPDLPLLGRQAICRATPTELLDYVTKVRAALTPLPLVCG